MSASPQTPPPSAAPTPKWPLGGPSVYAVLFFLAFALSVVMLATDSNLRTNFGTLPSGYYAHWYVVLVTAIADLVGGILLLLLRSPLAVKLGVLGSGLLSAIFLGDIFTYSQVGFSSATQMADYLFGVTYYGGDLRYLYDMLFATYLVTFVWGLLLLILKRQAKA